MKKLTWDQAKCHLPPDVSPEICTYATDVLFAGRHYLFTWTENGRQVGYCTRCHKESFVHHHHKHNVFNVCPKCHFDVVVKHRRYKHTKLLDFAYLVWYDKSPVDPSVVVARGFFAIRDLRWTFKDVQTRLMMETFYLFRPGVGGQMFYDSSYDPERLGEAFRDGHPYGPREAARVHSRLTNYAQRSWVGDTGCNPNRVSSAVAGTPLQYVPLDQYWPASPDMVKLFDLASRYPSVEYLTKLGCQRIINERLQNGSTSGAINWQGKTPSAVLKIPKTDARDVIGRIQRGMTSNELRVYQIARKAGLHFSDEQIKIAISYGGSSIHKIHGQIKSDQFVSDVNYLLKQIKVSDSHYTWHTLNDFRDYLSQCEQLNMDAARPSIRYPKNLERAHRNLTRKIKYRDDAAVTAKIEARLPELLRKYGFETSQYIIRPAASVLELIKEGNELSHCVGSYAGSYANGATIILFIRSKKRPSKPFYTVEIRRDSIVQCRGFNNRLPSKTVKAFLTEFSRHISKTGTAKRQTKAS